MIFKVYYQDNATTAPIREHTKSIYVEAESEKDIFQLLAERSINIEYIQKLEGAHLEYERKSKYFKLENV